MGLLDRFKKKSGPVEEQFFAHADGKMIPIEAVSDPTFAQELLGKSIAILPETGVLRSPADGEMTVVFETGHAVAMRTKIGADVLLHIGVDTVTLSGKGFNAKVAVGDRVRKGDILVEFDLPFIIKSGFDPMIPMIVTNSDDFSIELNSCGETVSSKDAVMTLKDEKSA
jgi:PTS system beta-glucosides-specific IIC component